MREVKAQTRVLKSHLEERLKRQLDWSEPLATWLVRLSKLLVEVQNSNRQEDAGPAAYRKTLETSSCGVWRKRAAFLPVAGRREGRVAAHAERLMDGIFVGHHERTGASLFFSERGFLRGPRVQRKTADQQWDNEFVRKCRGVLWILIWEELEVSPPPVPAVVMPAPEAIVRTPQERRRYMLKQGVARYGPTPG